ncbi:MAG TPA: hypothetical protein VFX37_11355 [Pseudolabrys sp.]|nr:hypothetical protein [Pseudolabrys sp.]
MSDTVTNEPPPRRNEHELTESFFSANAQERRFILTNLDAFVPIAGHRTLGSNPEIIREIENVALARGHTRFVTVLERAVDIRRDLAERVVNDVSGEPIVVIARALGMSSDVLQRVLLFINPHVGQSVARVFSLASLFEEITPAAAEDMISLWRNAGRQRRTPYEPLLWDDERTKPRAAAIHASSPAERLGQGALPARLRENGR